MSQRQEDYDRARGLQIVVGCALLFACLQGVSYVFRAVGDTAEVAHEQFGARASLAKYEWFRDAATQLAKKQADIQIYEQRQASLAQAYEGQPRSAWAREDREQASIWASELAGIKASYNTLVAEYNANMAKFNWRFANRPDLGAGALLPAAFPTYETE